MIPDQNTTHHSLVLAAALSFAKAGCSVVPAAMNGSKAPIGTWKQYQGERADDAQIMAWFNPAQTGLGVITGAVSGNLEMVEVEGRAVAENLHVEVKEIAYNSGLQDVWDRIATGYLERTPSGGLHFLYRISDANVPGNTKLARRPGENGGVDVLAETRGEGGFVVVAPSHGSVHPSGSAWELWRGSPETIPTLTWDERCAIVACFKALDAMPVASTVIDAISPREQSQGVTPGDDFNDRGNWNDILLPLGWSKVFTSGSTTYWRRPGKSIGISATTGRNDGDNLFVFTTSTTFEAERPYSKWAAFTHIHFNGDFKASARHLRTMGYGSIAVMQESELHAPSNAPLTQPLANEKASVMAAATVDSSSEASAESDGIDYERSSWKPEDLTKYLDGTYVPVEPTMLKRDDGKFLLYPGKVHSFYGESESGKSWVAQIAVVEALAQGKKVVFIDFESDAPDVVLRLKSLGATKEQILNLLRYVKPDSARDHFDPYWKQLLEPNSAELVIIDGVTEALTMWGGETKDNDAITRWVRLFPRAIAASSGACVVQIDHVTKNAESRGRFAIGGQAKLAALDGAGYLIEPIEVLAPGHFGQLSLRVTKDRPGGVRKDAGMYRKSDRTQEAAIINVDSTLSPIHVSIKKPLPEEELDRIKVDELHGSIARFINDHPGMGKKDVLSGVKVKGKDTYSVKSEAIDLLIADGFIECQVKGNKWALYPTNEGRERFDLPGQRTFGDSVGA